MFLLRIWTVDWKCISGWGRCRCWSGCWSSLIIGLPLWQWLHWRNNRERTSPQDALMVAFILPVDSCAAAFFLTWFLANIFEEPIIYIYWYWILDTLPLISLSHFQCFGTQYSKTHSRFWSILKIKMNYIKDDLFESNTDGERGRGVDLNLF